MLEYPKIQTLYDRDPDDMKHVMPGAFSHPAFETVSRWLVTEKVDGTNVRVILVGGAVRFGGRTDSAQMPVFLLDRLAEMLPRERVADAFDSGTSAVLFGEGYGPRIQKGGGLYRDDPGFRLFDVAVLTSYRTWWGEWDDVEDVARKGGVKTVPVLGDMRLDDALLCVRSASVVAREDGGVDRDQEGIVARSRPLLFTRRGDRVVWKLKARDLT